MTAAQDLFVSNCDGQRAIELQSCNSGASKRRQAVDPRTMPAEMVNPRMSPRIVQPCFTKLIGINGESPCSLSQGTGDAGKGEVIKRAESAGGNRNNMIDVESSLLTVLR